MSSADRSRAEGACFVPSTTPLPVPKLSDYLFEPIPWHWRQSKCTWPPFTKPSQIRVLKNMRKGVSFFEDGTPKTQTIVCELEVIDLDESHEPYIALSYSVGSPVPSWYPHEDHTTEKASNSVTADCFVLCNGGTAYITQNLQDFLITIAHETPIWVDALCVDQSNLEEKSAQIAMFDRIYLEAESTSIWLGPPDKWSDIAISLMEDIADRYAEVPADQRVQGVHQFNDPTLFARLGRPPFSVEEFEAIILFFSRTWFRRIWMVQEIALSQSLAFSCGRSLLDYSVMVAFVEWLCFLNWEPSIEQLTRHVHHGHANHVVSIVMQVFVLTRACQTGIQQDGTMRKIYRQFAPDDDASQVAAVLGLLISVNRHKWATNARDKIFAMLGLVRNACKDDPHLWSLLQPDYRKSIRDVYSEATAYVVAETRTLSMLSWTASRPDEDHDGTSDLPTWVPDFATGSSEEPLLALDTYNASASWDYEDVGADDENVLHIQGLRVGTINDCTPNIMPYLNTHREIARYLEFVMTAHAERVDPVELDAVELLFKLLTLGLFDPDSSKRGRHHPYTTGEAKFAFQTWFSFHLSLWLLSKGYAVVTIDLPSGYLPVALQSPYFPTAEAAYMLHKHVVLTVDDYQKKNPDGNWTGQGLDAVYADALQMFEGIAKPLWNRCLFSTDEGVLGVGPDHILPDDEVWILRGGRIPFVLRKATESTYSIVGECYAHGLMNGEAFQRPDWEDDIQELRLI